MIAEDPFRVEGRVLLFLKKKKQKDFDRLPGGVRQTASVRNKTANDKLYRMKNILIG
jgi:hypothetical protein